MMRKRLPVMVAATAMMLLVWGGGSAREGPREPTVVPEALLATCYGGAISCVTCESLNNQCTGEFTDACEYTEYAGPSRLCIDETQKCYWTSCHQNGKYCQNVGNGTSLTCVNDTLSCTGTRDVWYCLERWFAPPDPVVVWCSCNALGKSTEDCPGDRSTCHYESS